MTTAPIEDTATRDALAAARRQALEQGTGIAYYDEYLRAWAHQRACAPVFMDLTGGTTMEPSRSCLTAECVSRVYEAALARGDRYAYRPDFDVCRRYAWAVPNQTALDTIAEVSPAGLVEIGAGGGYWAFELRARGVDVVAFDPHPPGDHPANDGGWHSGYAWSEVRFGDHRAAANHPDRTLFVCWPTMAPWAGQAVAAYHAAGGRTVVYIGEVDGMTGDDDLWHRLGLTNTDSDRPDTPPAQFSPVRDVAIPRWAGVRDRLTVAQRTEDT